MLNIQNLSIRELDCLEGLLLFANQKITDDKCLQIIIDDKDSSISSEDNCKQSESDEDSDLTSSSTLDDSSARLDEPTSSSAPPLQSRRRKITSSPSPGRQDRPKRPSKPLPISNDQVQIGDGDISVPMSAYQKLKWNNPSKATKGLLDIIFTRSILATHNLSGKPSPAFPNRQVKGKLDEKIVKNIISEVIKKTNADERIIRNAITQKCADTAKLQARQLNC